MQGAWILAHPLPSSTCMGGMDVDDHDIEMCMPSWLNSRRDNV
jgi:hypothetical protein